MKRKPTQNDELPIAKRQKGGSVVYKSDIKAGRNIVFGNFDEDVVPIEDEKNCRAGAEGAEANAAQIPAWTCNGSIVMGNDRLQTNGNMTSGGMLIQMMSGPGLAKPPMSTILDRSTNLHFWIDVNSKGGQLEVSNLFLCSTEFLFSNRNNLLLLAKGVHATALPILHERDLPFGITPQKDAVDVEYARSVLFSVLDVCTMFSAPLQRLVADYLGSPSLLVGLVHYPEIDYVNVGAFGTSVDEIYDKTFNQLRWSMVPNKFIEVDISNGSINQLAPKLPRIMQQSFQMNVCHGETIIHIGG